jgi:hypothetical protein
MQSFDGRETPILKTLAFVIGSIIEAERTGAPPADPMNFRAGMALIEIVIHATGWFAIVRDPAHRIVIERSARGCSKTASPYVLTMKAPIVDWCRASAFGTPVAPDLMPTPEADPPQSGRPYAPIVPASFYVNAFACRKASISLRARVAIERAARLARRALRESAANVASDMALAVAP